MKGGAELVSALLVAMLVLGLAAVYIVPSLLNINKAGDFSIKMMRLLELYLRTRDDLANFIGLVALNTPPIYFATASTYTVQNITTITVTLGGKSATLTLTSGTYTLYTGVLTLNVPEKALALKPIGLYILNNDSVAINVAVPYSSTTSWALGGYMQYIIYFFLLTDTVRPTIAKLLLAYPNLAPPIPIAILIGG